MGVSLMKMTGNKIDIIEVIRVYIIVNDIDDNECFFTPGAKQTINLPEDIEPHTHINIPLYQPLDLDAHPDHTINSDRIFLYTENITNGRQTEVIPNSQIVNLPFKLIILPTGSLIKPYSLSLYLATALDYEKVTRYNLIIEANSKYGSRNQSCFLQLIIMIRDRNDHKPFFVTNYSEINIFENFDISLPIYTFKATDLDSGDVYSKIIYELDSEAPEMIKSTFYVNPLNGSLYLKHN
ncbi:unnamed protein product [Heterobilharzia americana]|nr:unnamed protein product [Heterobilharzia americana]